ncbi:hypothetical protein [Caballeronia sp. LZ035]|uniref:hypothetical protein n=1 Tax=Caballeronia sp. LZ035 TaxID=3038568 RepID=UPI00285F4810|nr:hypothetical protein [Caballeronia sp. LZ035]MDR5761975.1 hypothetical protein [Caballeronia sp. LZ035]
MNQARTTRRIAAGALGIDLVISGSAGVVNVIDATRTNSPFLNQDTNSQGTSIVLKTRAVLIDRGKNWADDFSSGCLSVCLNETARRSRGDSCGDAYERQLGRQSERSEKLVGRVGFEPMCIGILGDRRGLRL